ncbi:hypothetical protein PR003_g20710 [Phytophthora rubi]|uniref:Uncharacterized protein n=1 Tax=Phytophthora rubi TaxID=129364 RepID=A0A6A4DU75_9STRA|nr:hypothetical protein PR003_g20710 [Phytophthora rubi]
MVTLDYTLVLLIWKSTSENVAATQAAVTWGGLFGRRLEK